MRLRDFLTEVEYEPALLRLSLPPAGTSWDVDASAEEFLARHFGGAYGRVDLETSLRNPGSYSQATLSDFRALPPDGRADVLAWETLLLHEITHHIDYLSTPFGVAFHMYLMSEAMAFIPSLDHLAADTGPDIRGAMIETPELLGEGIADLLGSARGVEAHRPITARDVTEGWSDGPPSLSIFGLPFEPVTIFERLQTIRDPESPSVILSARAVVEAHAIGNCLRWVLVRFGNDFELAQSEITRYISTFYPAHEASADYRFVLKVFSRPYGADDIEGAVQGLKDIGQLSKLVELMSEVTWFALHHAHPASRLLYAFAAVTIEHLEPDDRERLEVQLRSLPEGTWRDRCLVALHRGKPSTTSSALYSFLDSLAPDEGGIEAVLQDHLQLIRFGRGILDGLAQEIGEHFAHVISATEDQLERRLSSGYQTPRRGSLGGDPLAGAGREEVKRLSLKYEAPATMEKWLLARDELLYRRRATSDSKRAAIREYREVARQAPISHIGKTNEAKLSGPTSDTPSRPRKASSENTWDRDRDEPPVARPGDDPAWIEGMNKAFEWFGSAEAAKWYAPRSEQVPETFEKLVERIPRAQTPSKPVSQPAAALGMLTTLAAGGLAAVGLRRWRRRQRVLAEQREAVREGVARLDTELGALSVEGAGPDVRAARQLKRRAIESRNSVARALECGEAPDEIAKLGTALASAFAAVEEAETLLRAGGP